MSQIPGIYKNYRFYPLYRERFPLAFFTAICQYIDMVCVNCGSETHVVNSRLKKRLNIIWRRRECNSCGSIFTTEETAAYNLLWVVKGTTGKLKPFSRDKLYLSLFKACEHRKTAVEDAGAITDTVISYLLANQTGPRLNRAQIRNACLISLNRFDKAAFTHYQAFHI